MQQTNTTARAIEGRFRVLAPVDHIHDPSTPAGAVLVALAAVTEATEPCEAAGVFEWAGEASTEYTTDGCWDDEIDTFCDEYAEDCL